MRNISTYLLILIVALYSFSFANANTFQNNVDHIVKILQCTQAQAINFMHYIDNFANEVKTNFTDIASEKVSDSKKEKLIQQTINKYFESTTSSVQVSSLNHNSIQTYPVNEYLNHLSNLCKTRYTRVELYFKPDYISMGTIHPYHDPTYGKSFEFKVGVWQIFKSYIGDRQLYFDATQKDFILIFHKEEQSDFWTLKIKSIIAKETVTLDNFENKWR